ncbi:MAG: HD domain-containing protein [Candidatus Omnitrophica bacterium]|nr:HD domain-containing protein [Candidatus Omnitrophota bacterium]
MKLRLSDLKKIKFLKDILRLADNSQIPIYLVGGCLRDCLLSRNREYLDFDFALSKGSLRFARRVSHKLNAPFVLLDEPHGVARVVFKNKDLIANLDFSDFRAASIEDDLGLRDFTVNALAIKLSDIFSKRIKLKQAIIDPCNGVSDLARKMIRHLSKVSFKDDPLRMLRTFSLSGRLGFRIKESTIELIKKENRLIEKISPERIREELFKIFSHKHSSNFIISLEKSGLLVRLIPEIKLMHRLKGGAYHHLDVWRHSLETLRQLENIIDVSIKKADVRKYLYEEISSFHKRFTLLKFASLMHDVGKPQTFSSKGEEIHFYGHERIGAKIAERIGERLRLSLKEIKMLKTLIYWHLRPGFMADIQDLSRRALFRYFRDTGTEAASVALLSLADQRATRGRLKRGPDRKSHEQLIRLLLRHYFSKAKKRNKPPFINGHDVIRSLRLKPGPLIGRILNEVNEAQAEGVLRNKRQALLWAKKFYKKINKLEA